MYKSTVYDTYRFKTHTHKKNKVRDF